MIKKIKILLGNQIIRYIFFGGLTTLVNLISYFMLRNICNISINISNVISISLSILFAYVVNSKYVFHTKQTTIKSKLYEFSKFISARFITMLIEIIGVFLFTSVMQIQDFISKLLIQVIVLILNYVFSKLLVFKKSTHTLNTN